MKHNHPASVPRTHQPPPSSAGAAAPLDDKASAACAGGAASGADAELSLELDQSAGYTAEHAALAFGIPRVAPVPTGATGAIGAIGATGATGPDRVGAATAAQGDSSRRYARAPAAGEAEPEDPTESLTGDEREVSVPAPRSGEEALPGAGGERLGSGPSPGPADPGPRARPIGEVVTAVLPLPKSRAPELRPAWGGTERLPLSERAQAAVTLSGLRITVAPPAEVGTGSEPAEAKTTTVTLPVASQHPPAVSAWRELAWRGLLFVGGAVTMGVVLLAVRALPITRGPERAASLLAPRGRSEPGRSEPSRREPSRREPGRSEPGRERLREPLREQLIVHALRAIAAGHREQAVTLLGRYQDSGPAAEHAVELMLRVLKKDLGATAPAR